MSERALTAEKARLALLVIWFFFFFLALGIFFYLYSGKWIEDDNFTAALSVLNTLYVPYLGVITLFYFGAPGKRRRTALDAGGRSGTAAGLALAGSLLWNCGVIFFVVRLAFHYGLIEVALDKMKVLGSMLSWLAAPAIGFFFARSS